MVQFSTKPVPGTVYFARPTSGGGAPALYTAPQYTDAPVDAPTASMQPSAPAKSWAPWIIGGLIIGGGAYLLLRD